VRYGCLTVDQEKIISVYYNIKRSRDFNWFITRIQLLITRIQKFDFGPRSSEWWSLGIKSYNLLYILPVHFERAHLLESCKLETSIIRTSMT
jgi:hypothetical protein